MGWTERQFLEENTDEYIDELLVALKHKYGGQKS